MSLLNNISSWSVSIMRLGRGLLTAPERLGPRPKDTLILFEFEACPFCRKVREVMTELDLSYISYPCTRGSQYRDVVQEKGGQEMFPYLIDPNTGTEMYESESIITYLHQNYGARPRTAFSKAVSPLNTLGSSLASLPRPIGQRVQTKHPKTAPVQMLTLYNFEASPYCRKVREALNALDLPCRIENVGKRSPRRPALIERGGKMMVPYLIDPNTQTELYESDDIVRYLKQQYE